MTSAVGAAPGAGAAFGAVEVILDASGSMLQKLDGTRRIEIARDSLKRLLGDVIPAGTPFKLITPRIRRCTCRPQ